MLTGVHVTRFALAAAMCSAGALGGCWKRQTAALQPPQPVVAPANVAPVATPPTASPAPSLPPPPKRAALPSGVHPVLFTGTLMGGVLNGKFIDDETMKNALKGGEAYTCYTQTARFGLGYGDAVEEDDETGILVTLRRTRKPGKAKSAKTSTEDSLNPPQWITKDNADVKTWDIAVCGDWNAIPRTPREGKTSDLDIRKAVQTLLQEKGIKKPHVNVTHVWKVDLDGDGNRELVVDAVTPSEKFRRPSFNEHTVKPGDYALVMLMQPQGDGWKSSLVCGDIYAKTKKDDLACEYSTGGFYDIDGDGYLEILVHCSSPATDGGSMTFYRLESQGAVATSVSASWAF